MEINRREALELIGGILLHTPLLLNSKEKEQEKSLPQFTFRGTVTVTITDGRQTVPFEMSGSCLEDFGKEAVKQFPNARIIDLRLDTDEMISWIKSGYGFWMMLYLYPEVGVWSLSHPLGDLLFRLIPYIPLHLLAEEFMKIERKEFQHPAGSWSKGFWWDTAGNCKKNPDPNKGVWVPKTISEVRQGVMDFVNTLAPEKVVSINEYTTCKNILGDDKLTHFVVWYWNDAE